MSNIFYTADPHFGHQRIIELCDRPFASADEMDDAILDNINATCSATDTLVILGDLALSGVDAALERVRAINARTVLVPGNHDKCSFARQRKGDLAAKVARAAESYESAFDVVLLETLDAPSQFVALGDFDTPWGVSMSHYPYVGDSHGDGDDRYGHLRPLDHGGPLLHGHVHGEWRFRDRMFNVGVDVNDFAPVSIDTINEWLATL